MTRRLSIPNLCCVLAMYLAARPAAAQWEYVGAPDGGTVQCIAQADSVLLIGTDFGGGYRSVDWGAHWEKMIVGSPAVTFSGVAAFAVGPNNLVIAYAHGAMFRSTNLGLAWDSLGKIPGEFSLRTMHFCHDTLLMSLSGPVADAIVRSTTGGISWDFMNSGMEAPGYAFAIVGDEIFVASNIVRRWNREFGQWDSAGTGAVGAMNSICAWRDTLLVAGDSGVFRSLDAGRTWTRLPLLARSVRKIAAHGRRIVATRYNEVYQSTDAGTTWTIDPTSTHKFTPNDVLVTDTATYLASTGFGVWCSSAGDASWRLPNSGIREHQLAAFIGAGAHLYLASDPSYSSAFRGMFRSDDSGRTWSVFDSGFVTDPDPQALIADDTVVYAVGSFGGLCRSTPRGWTVCTADSGGFSSTYSVARLGSKLFLGGRYLFVSEDNGFTWKKIPTYGEVNGVASVGGVLIAAGWSVQRSQDSGRTWPYDTSQVGKPWNNGGSQFSPSPQRSAVIGDTLYMSGESSCSRLFKTTDLGRTWSYAPTEFGGTVSGLVPFGTGVFLTKRAKVLSGPPTCVNWVRAGDTAIHSIAANLPPGSQGLAILGAYLYVATNFGVYRRPLADILVSVGVQDAPTSPSAIILNQNYPNPFSGATTIAYSVIPGERATLQVFDVLGREVAMLATDARAGNHVAHWDASTLPRGMYVCRLLTSGGGVGIVRMRVMR